MSVFGKIIQVSIFGESHSAIIGITIHHFPHNIELNLEKIALKLKLRRGLPDISTTRKEIDEFEIVSGYFNGKTTGAPLTIIIKNSDVRSTDYDRFKDIPRPSHADYPAYIKYDGCNDYRGGGMFSGRLTALLVVLGSICEDALIAKGYKIVSSSRVKEVHGVIDQSEFTEPLAEEYFPVIDLSIKEKMLEEIKSQARNGNSVGGIIETNIFNVPIGLGEPLFDSFESMLSHLVFSIGGVKGLEFGEGFKFVKLTGKEASDEFVVNEKGIDFKANHNGGINGGITNGNTINFKTIFKPTPSIALSQNSVNLKTNLPSELVISGRHDPIIAIKGLHVINSICYYLVLEMLMESNKWI